MTKHLISQRIQHVSTEVSMNITCQYFMLPQNFIQWNSYGGRE